MSVRLAFAFSDACFVFMRLCFGVNEFKFWKIKTKKEFLESSFALFRRTIYILYFCFRFVLTRFQSYGKKKIVFD